MHAGVPAGGRGERTGVVDALQPHAGRRHPQMLGHQRRSDEDDRSVSVRGELDAPLPLELAQSVRAQRIGELLRPDAAAQGDGFEDAARVGVDVVQLALQRRSQLRCPQATDQALLPSGQGAQASVPPGGVHDGDREVEAGAGRRAQPREGRAAQTETGVRLHGLGEVRTVEVGKLDEDAVCGRLVRCGRLDRHNGDVRACRRGQDRAAGEGIEPLSIGDHHDRPARILRQTRGERIDRRADALHAQVLTVHDTGRGEREERHRLEGLVGVEGDDVPSAVAEVLAQAPGDRRPHASLRDDQSHVESARHRVEHPHPDMRDLHESNHPPEEPNPLHPGRSGTALPTGAVTARRSGLASGAPAAGEEGEENRAGYGTRTRNPRITSTVRYQLRQAGSARQSTGAPAVTWSAWGSGRRPSGSATGSTCSTRRWRASARTARTPWSRRGCRRTAVR